MLEFITDLHVTEALGDERRPNSSATSLLTILGSKPIVGALTLGAVVVDGGVVEDDVVSLTVDMIDSTWRTDD